MGDLLLFLNSSVTAEYCNSTESIRAMRNETSKPIEFIVGVLVPLFVFLCYKPSEWKSAVKIRLFEKTVLYRTLVLLAIVIMLPILIALLAVATCYKLLCSVIIKRKDKNFVSFLDNFDVFWHLEDDSVINVLGIIESDSAEALLENIKFKLENLVRDETIDKIFYRRYEEYGFYYWRKHSLIDMSEYIEIIDLPDKEELDVNDLENILTDLAMKSLPYDDAGLFKVIITKQRVRNCENTRGEYGIIFRIHHSVGDGAALIEFLCESIADKRKIAPVSAPNMTKSHNYLSPSDIIDMIKKLCVIPMCIVNLILRKPDENALHGPSLTRIHNFKWTESDENLLTMVKEIKENVDEFNFSDVIMTAVAGGLNNYFNKTMAHVPEDVTIMIPLRFPTNSAVKNPIQMRLANDFIVALFDLPVKEHKNLETIKDQYAKFRRSKNEILAYHYFLKLTSILPKQILRPMFYSRYATLVLSNLPGPERLTIFGGDVLKKLVFFLPLKGTQAMAITAFCYGGVLRLAVSADNAVLSKPEDLTHILNGMVDEIKRLHAQHVKAIACTARKVENIYKM